MVRVKCAACRSGLDCEKGAARAYRIRLGAYASCSVRSRSSHSNSYRYAPCLFAVETAPTVPVECSACGSGLDREKGAAHVYGVRTDAYASCSVRSRSSHSNSCRYAPCLFAVETAPTGCVDCSACGSGLDREKGAAHAYRIGLGAYASGSVRSHAPSGDSHRHAPCLFAVETAPTVCVMRAACGSGLDREKRAAHAYGV